MSLYDALYFVMVINFTCSFITRTRVRPVVVYERLYGGLLFKRPMHARSTYTRNNLEDTCIYTFVKSLYLIFVFLLFGRKVSFT